MNQLVTFRNDDFNTSFFSKETSKQNCISTKKKLKVQYSDIEIGNILNFYKDEYIYIKTLEIKDGKFFFTFRKFDYPYFKWNVKHLTREQTIAFVTQAAYLFGAVNNEYDYNWDYPLEKFYMYIKNEQLGFTDINIKYRQFTENKENTVLIFNSVNYRKYNDKLFGEINFELEKYCVGVLKFFINL